MRSPTDEMEGRPLTSLAHRGVIGNDRRDGRDQLEAAGGGFGFLHVLVGADDPNQSDVPNTISDQHSEAEAAAAARTALGTDARPSLRSVTGPLLPEGRRPAADPFPVDLDADLRRECRCQETIRSHSDRTSVSFASNR